MTSTIFSRLRALKGGAATVALIAGLAATPAWAQEAPAAADAATEDQADVVVTGSRIVSPVATSASPLQVIDTAAIEHSGVINVQSLLNQYPVVSAQRSGRTNSSFAASSAGISTVDLRGLDVNRTLVLVNGRRFVSGVPGNFAVDLNVIPTGFIDRVDILTGGASAVYGSDAVAGVVNFVYKKNFEGIEAGGQVGITERGDGFDRVFDLTLGRNFAEGRGNIMLYGSYSKEDPVRKGERNTEGGSMAIDSAARILFTGQDGDAFVPVRPDLSPANPRGRYMTGPSTTFTYDPSGALRPCFSANGGICNAPGSVFNGQRIGPDGFNRSEYRLLAIPVERFVGALRGNFEVSPALNLFVEGNYARTEVSTTREPFPLRSVDLRPTASSPPPSGLIAIQSRVNGVVYDNAFVPAAILARAVDNDGDGLKDMQFDKRLTEFGPNQYQVKRDTFRIAGGANGEIAAGWRYEAYGLYGESKERQVGTGLFNGPNLLRALSAIVDRDDINGNGNRTEIICTDAAARAAGCIPANIYGEGSLAASAAYVGAGQTLDTKVTQAMAGATVSGQLFSLSGVNPVAVAVGGEYRRETSRSVADVLTQGGLNGNNATPPTRGAYSIVEGYAEAIAPILEERPGFHSLLVRGAVRVSEYTTVGGTFSYNYGAEWAPVPDVRFRVMNARSVRAPNLDELFKGAAESFPSGLTDPCTGVTATQTGALADNCRAAPGVSANIAANGAFRTTTLDRQSVTSFVGGNPDLFEEKGNSFTAGVAITPRSLGGPFRNLLLTVDYFNIRVDDAITVVPQQLVLNLCYRNSDAAACQFVTRRATAGLNSAGSLARVDSGGINSADLRTRGIDVAGSWRADVAGGSFGLRGSYTHLFEQSQRLYAGGPRDALMAEVGRSRDRFTTSASFDRENGPGLTLTGTYIGPAYIADELGGAVPGTNKAYRIHPEFYLDGQIRFNVTGGFQFYIGAYNLLDNTAPYLAEVGSNTGQDTNTGVYDALGRRFYAGARVRF